VSKETIKAIKGEGNKLKSIRLVGHPGGHDGGVFPCRETFELVEGGVRYNYGVPYCPVDTFVDEDPEIFNKCPTKNDAIIRLKADKHNLQEAMAALERTLTALENGAAYTAFPIETLYEEGESEEVEYDESDEDE
jgi:hypothetical protein